MTPAELTAAVANARREQGLTQRQVAAKAGRGVASVCGWERGRNDPGLSSYVAVADALGLEVLVRPRDRGDLPEDAPALCKTGCGSPVAWEGAYCDPCDRQWLDNDNRARRRDDR